MTTDNARYTFDLLDQHGAWMRRLVRGLVGDPALGEDLAQETWETALRRPPDKLAATRGWLGQVLLNRLRNHLREQGRRRAREEYAAKIPIEAPATPEEATARLELQRRVGALIATLGESEQQILYLRFYEDREPTEIAQLLNVPAGTIRWRLKSALDELRHRLDVEHGGKRDHWLAIFGVRGPAVGSTAGPAGASATSSGSGTPTARGGARRSAGTLALSSLWRLALALVAGTLALAAIAFVMRGRPLRAWRSFASPLASARSGGARIGPPALERPAAIPPTLPAGCDEARVLNEEIARRRRELEPSTPLIGLFAQSAPNPIAQQRFEKIVDEVLGPPGKCAHTLECRGLVCRAQILAPSPIDNYGDCFANLPGDRLEFVPAAYLDYPLATTVDSGTPVHDPISGQSFLRFDLHYHLVSPTGDPIARALRPPRAEPTPGWHRRHPPLPPGRSPACRTEVARLESQLSGLESSADDWLGARVLFPLSEPNPELVPEVIRRLEELTGLHGDPFPLIVECHGPACALRPRDVNDPNLKIHWNCRWPGGDPTCPKGYENSWFARLSDVIGTSDFFVMATPAEHDPESPVLVLTRKPNSAEADPFVVLCGYLRRVRDAGGLETCARASSNAQGELNLMLTLPNPRDPTGDQSHITVDANGSLADTPVGNCLLGALRDAAAAEEVPIARNGLVAYRTLKVPDIAAFWQQFKCLAP